MTSDLFYFDASMQTHLAEAFSLVRQDILYPGMPGCLITSPKVRDTVWLPIAGREGWIVIMRDKNIKHRPLERSALKDSGVRAFVLTAGGNLSKWATMGLLVRKWDLIEETASTVEPPFLCAITNGPPRLIDI